MLNTIVAMLAYLFLVIVSVAFGRCYFLRNIRLNLRRDMQLGREA